MKEYGEQCVMTAGIYKMPSSFVDNLGFDMEQLTVLMQLSLEKELARYGWMGLRVLDKRTNWMHAATTDGEAITAFIVKTRESIAWVSHRKGSFILHRRCVVVPIYRLLSAASHRSIIEFQVKMNLTFKRHAVQ